MHTAGPWHVYDMNPTTVLADRYSIGARAVADCTTPIKAGISREEAEANARLISAAPSLLVACEALLNATMFKSHPAESQMAIDAIAKAKGLGQ